MSERHVIRFNPSGPVAIDPGLGLTGQAMVPAGGPDGGLTFAFAAGATGPAGATGATGPTGPTGPTGANGAVEFVFGTINSVTVVGDGADVFTAALAGAIVGDVPVFNAQSSGNSLWVAWSRVSAPDVVEYAVSNLSATPTGSLDWHVMLIPPP